MNDDPYITPSPSDDWNPAPPETVPQPTVWPAALSLGTTLFFWGLISSVLLTIAGLLISGISLGGWIQDIRHERREP